MRALKLLSLAAVLCALALAAPAGERSRVRGGIDIKLGREKKAAGGGLRIAFERVLEDSRCPEGVRCVWEGNARVRLVATDAKGGRTEFELNTTAGPTEYRLGGYTIRLANLWPRPSAKGELRPGDYRATVVVSKLDQ